MTKNAPSHYELLGVSPRATRDEIRQAWLRLNREHHPDKTNGNKAAEARLKEINGAWDTLKKPAERRAYDDTLAAQAHTPPAEYTYRAKSPPSPRRPRNPARPTRPGAATRSFRRHAIYGAVAGLPIFLLLAGLAILDRGADSVMHALLFTTPVLLPWCALIGACLGILLWVFRNLLHLAALEKARIKSHARR